MQKPPSSKFYLIDPDAKAPTLKRLRNLSKLLDRAITIPGIGVNIGLDPILGLLPVGGDFLGVLFSAYIILEAARLGAFKATLGRMVINIIVDALVGAIPFLGDIFDFAWTANEYNLKLLEEHLKYPTQTKSADRWFVWAILAGLLFVAIGLAAFTVLIIRLLWGVITGS